MKSNPWIRKGTLGALRAIHVSPIVVQHKHSQWEGRDGFFESCDRIKKNLGTLNRNFVKEWGNFPYCGFPEPWVGKNRKEYPGWEMFFNEKLTFKEKPTVMIKEIQEEVN